MGESGVLKLGLGKHWVDWTKAARKSASGLLCFHAVSFALILGFVASGCGNKGAQEFSKECVVAEDQTASLKAYWATRPVPLAVEYGEFNSTEQAQIGAAIDTWNAFFKASRGYELFVKNGSPIQNVSGAPNVGGSSVCGSSIIAGSNFAGRVMIRKKTSWNYGSTTIALSTLCSATASGAPYKVMTNAIMEVNYKDYYSAGKSVPDLETITLHELGHILGLDHSCGAGGIISCGAAPASYLEAVMHPHPTSGGGSGTGGARRELRMNDQNRANCLYN